MSFIASQIKTEQCVSNFVSATYQPFYIISVATLILHFKKGVRFGYKYWIGFFFKVHVDSDPLIKHLLKIDYCSSLEALFSVYIKGI